MNRFFNIAAIVCAASALLPMGAYAAGEQEESLVMQLAAGSVVVSGAEMPSLYVDADHAVLVMDGVMAVAGFDPVFDAMPENAILLDGVGNDLSVSFAGPLGQLSMGVSGADNILDIAVGVEGQVAINVLGDENAIRLIQH